MLPRKRPTTKDDDDDEEDWEHPAGGLCSAGCISNRPYSRRRRSRPRFGYWAAHDQVCGSSDLCVTVEIKKALRSSEANESVSRIYIGKISMGLIDFIQRCAIED